MEARADHHEMPTGGKELNSLALTATLHCLTGCALGEILGVAIGTALGWSDFATIALAVTLAFLLGYSFTSYPLLRAGLALGAVIPVALAADTLSIATMEIVDNGVLLIVPGAMDAGLGSLLFWGSLSFALAVAFALTVPVNRLLLKRGKGHTRVHETGIHGGPNTRYVAVGVSLAAIFGTTVLVAEALGGAEEGHGGGHAAMSESAPAPVRGLSARERGHALKLASRQSPLGKEKALSFQILGEGGRPATDFDVEHEKRMHFIVAKSDLSSFQHLHPAMAKDGTWSTPLRLDEPGSYRVFADFKRGGANRTLTETVTVGGKSDSKALPEPAATAKTDDGYAVKIEGDSRAGAESELRFTPTLEGKAVEVEPYLGAGGHLVALRERDLAYLHVHPTGGRDESKISFATEFPNRGSYRLFLQFKHDGEVRTAAFTRRVAG